MTRLLTINNNLTVSGDIKLNNSIKDSSGSAGTNGYVLTSTGSGWNWAQSSGGTTLTNGTNYSNIIHWDSSTSEWVVNGSSSVKIGNEAGLNSSSTQSVAIGHQAGYSGSSRYGIAIGYQAAYSNQSYSSVAIGTRAGFISQQAHAIAIGAFSGNQYQHVDCVAIGTSAGTISQQRNAIAMGKNAGLYSQGTNAICIGYDSGFSQQQQNGIAIGYQSGYISQGTNSIAIGNQAGKTSQAENSIALNASGTVFSPATYGFYAAPVRNITQTTVLGYDTSNNEITYYTASSVSSYEPFNVSNSGGINSAFNSNPGKIHLSCFFANTTAELNRIILKTHNSTSSYTGRICVGIYDNNSSTNIPDNLLSQGNFAVTTISNENFYTISLQGSSPTLIENSLYWVAIGHIKTTGDLYIAKSQSSSNNNSSLLISSSTSDINNSTFAFPSSTSGLTNSNSDLFMWYRLYKA